MLFNSKGKQEQSTDDLDYEIRNIKDSIMKYKFDFDSSLLSIDNVFIVKSLLNEINKVKQ